MTGLPPSSIRRWSGKWFQLLKELSPGHRLHQPDLQSGDGSSTYKFLRVCRGSGLADQARSRARLGRGRRRARRRFWPKEPGNRVHRTAPIPSTSAPGRELWPLFRALPASGRVISTIVNSRLDGRVDGGPPRYVRRLPSNSGLCRRVLRGAKSPPICRRSPGPNMISVVMPGRLASRLALSPSLLARGDEVPGMNGSSHAPSKSAAPARQSGLGFRRKESSESETRAFGVASYLPEPGRAGRHVGVRSTSSSNELGLFLNYVRAVRVPG